MEDNQDNAQDHEEDKKDDTSDESSRWNFKIYKHSSKNKCFKIKQVENSVVYNVNILKWNSLNETLIIFFIPESLQNKH